VKHAIDRLRTFQSKVLCEGWFSGFGHPGGGIQVVIDGERFIPKVETVLRPDLIAPFGDAAEKWGFRLTCEVKPTRSDWYGSVQLLLDDGDREYLVSDPARIQYEYQRREASAAELEFFRLMNEASEPTVLEVGSRKRSGNAKTDRVPSNAKYTGFDIASGDNVDVVGDAHFMSRHLPANHFDFVFSISTFEHLLMPWKAAVELNAVMKQGGIAFIHSHQAWPVHDAPWDFYRFSKFGWHGIFNRYSGFEVIASEHAEPATIIPETQINNPATFLSKETGYLMSVCLIRKIGDTSLQWDADPMSIVTTAYPA
jgi:hypothetical protein